MKLRGPYSPTQKPNSPCGCYYPDVTRVRDDAKKLVRILYCIHCGEQKQKITKDEVDETVCSIPTFEERQAERERIRQGPSRYKRDSFVVHD